ncbi:MAG: 3-oxoacyl-ACP reductase, partial [Luminiphilus sp.]|nr:3-oxoacyl-ACP reductase [Luminiphilus sp.]
AGAGAYAVTKIVETEGMWLPEAEQTPEGIAAHWGQISEGGERALQAGYEQSIKMIGQAAQGLGLDLS